MNPSLKLVARLVFNPAPGGTLSNFTSFISPVTGQSIADTVVDSKYDSVVKRTSTSINRSFRMVSAFQPVDFSGTGAVTNCQALGRGGAGHCHTTSTIHERTTQAAGSGLWSTSSYGGYDQTGLVTILTAGNAGKFSFNETGQYGCTITLPAFATNGFTASLYNETTSTVVAQNSITAGIYSQATVTIDTKFNVTSTAAMYSVHEQCETDGSAGVNHYEYCTLGIPTTTSYSQYYVVVSVSCYKLDRSM